MALVGSDGPFSSFPGIDRQLLVLRGDGLALTIPGGGEIILDCDSAPFAFTGDIPITSRRLGSDVTDFNVMTRRGAFDQSLRCVSLAPGETILGEHEMTLLIPLIDDLPFAGDQSSGVLAPLDAIVLEKGELIRSALKVPASCLLLTLKRCLGIS